MKIGIFDSGIGGTTTMAAIKKLLPDEEYFYIADSKNCPYGEKTDEKLYKIVTENVKELVKWGADIVVIACNTATTRCIKQLRQDFPTLTFVGTEPAIKLATKSDAKNILILATPGTVSSERTAKLLAENQKEGQNISLLACAGLADAIEKNLEDNPEEIEAKLTELLSKVKIEPEIVVLGCTHYSLIKPLIKRHFKHAKLVDGNAGVARQVKSLIKKSPH